MAAVAVRKKAKRSGNLFSGAGAVLELSWRGVGRGGWWDVLACERQWEATSGCCFSNEELSRDWSEKIIRLKESPMWVQKLGAHHSSGVLEMNWLTAGVGYWTRGRADNETSRNVRQWKSMTYISLPCLVLGCNYFHCVFQPPQGSVSICTSRRIIQSSPLGNVNLTTSRSGMDRLASPQYSDATVASTAHPISGVAADICG